MQGRHISVAQPRPTQLSVSQDNVDGSSQAPTLADRQITASPNNASAAQGTASTSPSALAATNQRLPTEISATANTTTPKITLASIVQAIANNTMPAGFEGKPRHIQFEIIK